jgi:hypothetical protein
VDKCWYSCRGKRKRGREGCREEVRRGAGLGSREREGLLKSLGEKQYKYS